MTTWRIFGGFGYLFGKLQGKFIDIKIFKRKHVGFPDIRYYDIRNFASALFQTNPENPYIEKDSGVRLNYLTFISRTNTS